MKRPQTNETNSNGKFVCFESAVLSIIIKLVRSKKVRLTIVVVCVAAVVAVKIVFADKKVLHLSCRPQEPKKPRQLLSSWLPSSKQKQLAGSIAMAEPHGRWRRTALQRNHHDCRFLGFLCCVTFYAIPSLRLVILNFLRQQ